MWTLPPRSGVAGKDAGGTHMCPCMCGQAGGHARVRMRERAVGCGEGHVLSGAEKDRCWEISAVV